MASTCVVRERREDDLPALAVALVRVHARDGYPVEGVADPLAWLSHAGALRSWTALVNDVPIGQVTLADAEPGDDAANIWATHTGSYYSDVAIIVRLFVDPEHRTIGAGRSLLEAALDYAHQIGRSVALDVMIKDRAAIRLYERLGGQRVAEVLHRYDKDSSEQAAVFGFPR